MDDRPLPAPTLTPAKPVRGGASRRWDFLYGSLAVAGFPFLVLRYLKGKEDRESWRQKRGYVTQRDEHPQRVWIHAVSVGEVNAAQPLIRALRKELPGADLVLSTSTRTGQHVARQKYGEVAVFYFPFDLSAAVQRCFRRTKPALVVLLELEVWPNFTAEARARGVPVVVVNGRITERSARRYRRAWALVGGSFRRVHKWLMQSEEYAERVRALGVDGARVVVAGNVKYDDVDTQPLRPEQRVAAREALALTPDALVVLGGSTHPTEEAALLDAVRALSARFPALRLVLCPRHPHRLDEVEREITTRGFCCVRRTGLQARGARLLEGLNTEQRAQLVVLVDTMGELSRLYRAADVAFVGGSLIPHGGQNPMEPAGLGLPTLHGPHMHNFREAVEILKGCDGAVALSGPAELPGALERLLGDTPAAQAMGARARAAFLARQGASAHCAKYLKDLLGRLGA